jgi:hypothetical protein
MLKLRQLIPPLTLRTPEGRAVRAWDFKQKRALVIALLHSDCRECAQFAERLAARSAALADLDAVALVVFPEPPLASAAPLPPHIVVGADVSGRAARAFLGEDVSRKCDGGVGVFVADRYGELFAQWCGADHAALPGMEEVLGWLAQIQITCEECYTPHWPVD